MIYSLPLVLVVTLYWSQTLLDEWEGYFGYGHVEDFGLTSLMAEEFRNFDFNADGCIDPGEFYMLRQHFDKVFL